MGAEAVLKLLVKRFNLCITNRSRRNFSHLVNSGWVPPSSQPTHQQMLANHIDDPVQFALLCVQKQRQRNGGLAMALPGLRNVLPDNDSPIDWFIGRLHCHSIPIDIWDGSRQHGGKIIANYARLKIGRAYLIHERIDTLDRWSKVNGNMPQPTTVSRFRIIIPREVSPRGTTVYGDEIHIEQPASQHFFTREGWRCWLHRHYDESKPRSKVGALKVLKSETHSIYYLPDLFEDNGRVIPCLINWSTDSVKLAERLGL